IFPHDFYHPVANAFLGLRDPQQRPRIRNPVHRGSHGHLPGHPSERGYMVVFDESAQATVSAMQLADVAPTLLALAGQAAPPYMSGRSAMSSQPMASALPVT